MKNPSEPATNGLKTTSGKTGGRIGAKDYTGLNERHYGTPYPVGSYVLYANGEIVGL